MEVTIERILPGGLGLAHAEGRTVMVSLSAPGDGLRVRVDRVKGNVSFASIQEIIAPSPNRVAPPCPYFGRCGGCDFQQMTYQAQLNAKVEIIRDCLRRLARIENIPDFQIKAAPNPWHYRSRAQWQYDSISQRLGYFERGSRQVCDVSECAVLAPELQHTLDSLRELMRDSLLPEDVRDFRAVKGDEGVSLTPSVSRALVREGSGPLKDGERVSNITRAIHGETYQLNADSFFQANDDLVPQLIDTAIADATGETALDLYCGVGLFTLPLARRFKHLIGVEADSGAVSFTRKGLANAGLINVDVANRNVGDWLADNAVPAFPHPPDFLLLDPPRTGAESRVINGIIKLMPQRISYVSCDPATLARDLKKLLAGGYILHSLTAFDMFPQTHHVETVVHLRRGSH